MTKRDVRRGHVGDASACAAIVHRWLHEADWMPKPQPSLEKLTAMIEKGIPLREFWVMGDPAKGYLSFKVDENLIAGFYVEDPGKGMGSALIERVKSRHDYIQLWTHAPNTDAQRFYKRHGFKIAEEKPEGRGDGVAEFRMEWHA